MAVRHALDAGNFPHGATKNSRTLDDETERRISHFIPSLELTGSIAEKLGTLDMLMGYLQTLRANLVGNTAAAAPYERRGRYASAPDWPWFTAGMVLGALFVLMFFVARSWS